jgi:hypothetical protein
LQGRTTSEREKLLGMSAISLILIFFLSSVGSVLFMGLGLGAAGVAAHGALRQPDDLFLEDAAVSHTPAPPLLLLLLPPPLRCHHAAVT